MTLSPSCRLTIVVQCAWRLTVYFDYSDRGGSLMQPPLHHGPVELRVAKLTHPNRMEGLDLNVQECSVRWQRAIHSDRVS